MDGTPAYNGRRAYAAFAADTKHWTDAVADVADGVGRHEAMAGIDTPAASRCGLSATSYGARNDSRKKGFEPRLRGTQDCSLCAKIQAGGLSAQWWEPGMAGEAGSTNWR